MRFLFAAMLLCLPVSPVLAQNFNEKPFLSVQGHAETKVKPDIFPVEVTLQDFGTDPGKSQALVEGLAANVLAAAQAQGAKDADIDVGNLSVEPQTRYDDKAEKTVFLGNMYERAIEVRFRDLDSVRRFIAALPDSKHMKIETGTFQYSGRHELERKLRREAIADARSAAEDMAAAVGKRLVELHNVSDRAQSTIYSNMGYARASLDSVTVSGSRSANIVLKEVEITIAADAFLVYIIGD